MKNGRLLALGDIHGCLKTLIALMDKVQLTQEDTLVVLGDVIDRGPESFGVIDYLIELKAEFPKTVFLKGNHEDMFIQYLSNDCRVDEMYMFLYNGGQQTIASYNRVAEDVEEYINWENIPKSHQEFLSNLKVMHEEFPFVFVHAGIRAGFPVNEQLDHDMIWIRDEFLYNESSAKWEDRIVVHGHTPMEQPEMDAYHEEFKNKINLDTGCVFKFHLSCEDVYTRTRWTQDNIDMPPRILKRKI